MIRAALGGSVADFRDVPGTDLLDRWIPQYEWLEGRLAHEVDPYSKYTSGRITTVTEAFDRSGRRLGRGPSVNFASQDYLSLASHPQVLAAAHDAVERYGVHSAGSAALMGSTELAVHLEQRIAAHLKFSDCTVFPTGWGAGYGVVRTLVRASDHVVMDALSHACLQEGARSATRNVHLFPNNDVEGARRRLGRIRQEHPDAGILLITEGLFSMDSTTPDIQAMQLAADEHGATLLVDVAHDYGSLGDSGSGTLEQQDMLGRVDVVMGSFSKTFASNGGFVATNHPALKLALRYNCGPLTFTNALSPVQAACVHAALDIVQSAEGRERRERVMRSSQQLRAGLTTLGVEVLGEASAIVPAVLGSVADARLLTRAMQQEGFLVNLVEFPAVSRSASRWRLQVMADHTPAQIEAFLTHLHRAQAAVQTSAAGPA